MDRLPRFHPNAWAAVDGIRIGHAGNAGKLILAGDDDGFARGDAPADDLAIEEDETVGAIGEFTVFTDQERRKAKPPFFHEVFPHLVNGRNKRQLINGLKLVGGFQEIDQGGAHFDQKQGGKVVPPRAGVALRSNSFHYLFTPVCEGCLYSIRVLPLKIKGGKIKRFDKCMLIFY
jgi:hypothetical protein